MAAAANKTRTCVGPLAKQIVIIPGKDVDEEDSSEIDEKSEDVAETIYESEEEEEMRFEKGKKELEEWMRKEKKKELESSMKQREEKSHIQEAQRKTVTYRSWNHLKRQHAAAIERFERNMANSGHAASASADSEPHVEPLPNYSQTQTDQWAAAHSRS